MITNTKILTKSKMNVTKKNQCIVFDFANTLSSALFFQTRPESCKEWRKLFEKHIFADKQCITDWCKGTITTFDIAERIEPYTGMSVELIIDEMKKGCRGLAFNQGVLDFVKSQRSSGKKTALVTINLDIFSEIVVPAHDLESIFDVIVNSADYKTDDKTKLWSNAFGQLGDTIGYKSSLLIDDSEKWVGKFEEKGGTAYRYSNDENFYKWLDSNGHLLV